MIASWFHGLLLGCLLFQVVLLSFATLATSSDNEQVDEFKASGRRSLAARVKEARQMLRDGERQLHLKEKLRKKKKAKKYSHHLPSPPVNQSLQALVDEAYALYIGDTSGANADYIPELAQVNSSLFGVAIVTVDGAIYAAGDVDYSFAIESCSKVFTLADVMEARGPQAIIDLIGVEPTGLPFNSVLAIELHDKTPSNPLVNAGAICAVSLVDGADPDAIYQEILENMSNFAGAPLEILQNVYESEAATNYNNRGIANILYGSGYLYSDPVPTVDIYTKQCSIGVTTKQLGVMGATLANGGMNPITGDVVVDETNVPYILSVMLADGFYDASGQWSYKTGLPGKTGVGGGIFTVIPGKMSLVAFSPPLDAQGNSVRAQKAIEYMGQQLGLNLFYPRRQRQRRGRKLLNKKGAAAASS